MLTARAVLWLTLLVAAASPHAYHVPFTSMGTQGELVAWTTDDAAVGRAWGAAQAQVERVNTLMKPWGESELVQLNAHAGTGAVAVSSETFTVLARAQEFSAESGGLFDITFASMGALWRFDGPVVMPTPEAIALGRSQIGFRQLVLDARSHTAALMGASTQVGLGGIAKGYAVDLAVAELRAHGLHDFIVRLGGDLYASGSKGAQAWRIGLQDPRGNDSFAELEVRDAAFSTSGDYEHFFMADGRRYHHIIDPRTGYPATASRAVSVLAPDALTAEGLTKILFIGGAPGSAALARHPGSEAVIVTSDNQVWSSPGLRDRLRILHPPTP